MYPPNQSDYQDYQKYHGYAPPPTAPPIYNQPQIVTGVPVSSTNNQYIHGNGQPVHQIPPVRLESPWSTGLCDCCSDCSTCCITCWCPCITFGRISEIIDKGTSSCGANGAIYALITYFTGMGCMYSCFYRSKMRHQYMLKKSPCGDCLVHCCCELCALCQEYRELKLRGFDMSIGWQGNVARQNQGVVMAPGIQAGMTR